MPKPVFYGFDARHLKETAELLPGRLIVIEGTDGVGRSTQLTILRPWLESSGYAVVDTEMTRSVLAGPGLKRAKQGHTLGPITLNLFYATDFVDRFESQILPALRAGFIVLTDRYIYSLIARALVRGAEPHWIRSIYGLALKPDAIFYLRIDIEDLIPRVLQRLVPLRSSHLLLSHIPPQLSHKPENAFNPRHLWLVLHLSCCLLPLSLLAQVLLGHCSSLLFQALCIIGRTPGWISQDLIRLIELLDMFIQSLLVQIRMILASQTAIGTLNLCLTPRRGYFEDGIIIWCHLLPPYAP